MLTRLYRANIACLEAFRELDERFIDEAIASWDTFRWEHDGPLPTYEEFLKEYMRLCWYGYTRPCLREGFGTICVN